MDCEPAFASSIYHDLVQHTVGPLIVTAFQSLSVGEFWGALLELGGCRLDLVGGPHQRKL